MKGVVQRSTGSWYRVLCDDGVSRDLRVAGKVRLHELNTTNPIAVGDEVTVSTRENGGEKMIEDISPRQNYIIRQSPKKRGARHILAANLDQVILLVTLAHPRTSTGFIDRCLLTSVAYHIPVVLVFNKQDLMNPDSKIGKQQQEYMTYYRSIGYDVLETSAVESTGIQALEGAAKDKRSLLIGHSGVGKSSLLNALDPSLDLRTKEISKKYSKGVHTTTFAEMFPLPFGGEIIDAPGIKEFGVVDFDKGEVSTYMADFLPYVDHCKFANCLHVNEPNCAVYEAVLSGDIAEWRYINYLRILEDIDEAKAW